MPISDSQKTSILYNRIIAGKSYTASGLSTDEEPYTGRQPIKFTDVWVDEIPTSNPLINHNTYADGAVHPSTNSVIKKYHKIQLKPVTTSKNNKSFYYNSSFGDIIQSEYGDGTYQWELWKKDASGNYTVKIPYGLYNWIFDPINGILTFLDTFPPGIDNYKNLPAVTVYQYIGRKGSTDLFNATIPAVDDDTIELDPSNKLQIRDRYKIKTYVAEKLNANSLLVSNVFTITHSLNSKFIDVNVYENISNQYVKVMVPWKAINNSQVELYFTPSVKSGDFTLRIDSAYL